MRIRIVLVSHISLMKKNHYLISLEERDSYDSDSGDHLCLTQIDLSTLAPLMESSQVHVLQPEVEEESLPDLITINETTDSEDDEDIFELPPFLEGSPAAVVASENEQQQLHHSTDAQSKYYWQTASVEILRSYYHYKDVYICPTCPRLVDDFERFCEEHRNCDVFRSTTKHQVYESCK